MKTPVMGIQLYTLRDMCQNAKDFDRTLSAIAAYGVKDVQISAIGPIPAEEQKKILNKHNMHVCVTHKSYDRFINDIDNLIEEHKIIGCDAIGLGGMPGEFTKSPEVLMQFIKSIENISDKLKSAGMTFNYHNHYFEFDKLNNGKTLMEMLLENTSADYFHFIPDVAWMHYAGQNPAEYLKKMKGRVKVCHFKDYNLVDGKVKFCSLGQGVVNLKECFEACKELEIPYIMYEQDDNWVDNDPLKATKESWDFMNSLL